MLDAVTATDGGGVPVWGWVAIAIAIAAATALVACDQLRWNQLNSTLRDTADSLDAWPVAAARDGSLIVLLHRETATSQQPFLVLRGDSRSSLGGREMWRLARTGRLVWYRMKGNRRLGLGHLIWYLDANPELVPERDVLSREAPKWLTVVVLSACALFVGLIVLAMMFGW